MTRSGGGRAAPPSRVGEGQAYRIGELTGADAGEALTVQYAAYVGEARRYGVMIPPLGETLDELHAAVDDPAVLALGAWCGHRLVGAVRGLPDGERMEVARFVVAPDLYRRGVGRALLAAVHERAPGHVRTFWLITGARSEDNLRLYERAGYRVTGERTDAAGIGMVLLERPR